MGKKKPKNTTNSNPAEAMKEAGNKAFTGSDFHEAIK